MDRTTQRCNKCLMTASFPGICFDEEGICNECRNFKRIEPLGEGRLLEVLNSRKGDKYDCIIGISGGRDSSYVAYLAKEKFKLRGLAVFYDSPFYCDLARENVRTVCSNLNLDLKIVTSNTSCCKIISYLWGRLEHHGGSVSFATMELKQLFIIWQIN